jgi:hypothetical protein
VALFCDDSGGFNLANASTNFVRELRIRSIFVKRCVLLTVRAVALFRPVRVVESDERLCSIACAAVWIGVAVWVGVVI